MQTDDIHCFNYVACDIPPGMTIQAWKRERARSAAPHRHYHHPARRHPLRRLFGRAR